jgi:pyruvate dehydrogenase E2 component (dihydrolipoamide acetyltransferase)
MSEKINMPAVAAGSEEAVLARWFVQVGTELKAGEPLAEIETEKAMVEYLAETSGTVLQLVVAEGASVNVGDPIAIVGAPGEVVSNDDLAAPAVAPQEVAAPKVSTPVAPSPVLPQPPSSVSAPAAPVAPAAASVAGLAGQLEFASPIARKFAREKGVDLSQVVGTGPSGRKVRRDIERYLAEGGAVNSPTSPAVNTSEAAQSAPISESRELAVHEFSSGYVAMPISKMRRAIARRLIESKTTAPHFYVTEKLIVDDLLELRRKVNESAPRKITVNDLIIRAVGAAFVQVPEANVVWKETEIHAFTGVDIAVAVAAGESLLTPVIRGVDRRSLTEISAVAADLIQKATNGGLRQEDLEGGAFTISNLGMFGTDSFSAILNPPQSGIMAVGAAKPTPVVNDAGEVVVAQVMNVTLSFDHRVIDGALAARWVAAFKNIIENPLSMLI